ncbi:hypothetical protein ACH5RR_032602 [Cinchona calisaya]|uniref:Uncharacterized protein n=1 Tax=Cinchona calisaya TaxID=153742 RepID=A0ABD2YMR3_9GENT
MSVACSFLHFIAPPFHKLSAKISSTYGDNLGSEDSSIPANVSSLGRGYSQHNMMVVIKRKKAGKKTMGFEEQPVLLANSNQQGQDELEKESNLVPNRSIGMNDHACSKKNTMDFFDTRIPSEGHIVRSPGEELEIAKAELSVGKGGKVGLSFGLDLDFFNLYDNSTTTDIATETGNKFRASQSQENHYSGVFPNDASPESDEDLTVVIYVVVQEDLAGAFFEFPRSRTNQF